MVNLKTLSPKLVLFPVVATLSFTGFAVDVKPAGAVTFGYGCITNKSTANCQAGENQFQTKVSKVITSNNTTQVLFEFFNVAYTGGSSLKSSIAQVYFDDTLPNSLAGVAKVNYNNTGMVDFKQNFGPPVLPGGKNNGVNFNVSYRAGASAPVQPNGVNPNETLGILFNVKSGFTDPFNAVITDLQNGSLRIGIHAQGFSDGGSESFVNKGVPEPMTMLGSGIALGLGLLFKRKSAKIRQTNS